MNSFFDDLLICIGVGLVIVFLIVNFFSIPDCSRSDTLVGKIVGKSKTDGIHYLTVRAYDEVECIHKVAVKKESYNLLKIGEEFTILKNEKSSQDIKEDKKSEFLIGEITDKAIEGKSHFLIVKKNTQDNYKLLVNKDKYNKKKIGTLTSFYSDDAELMN